MSVSPDPYARMSEAQRRALVASVQIIIGTSQPFIVLIPKPGFIGADVISTIKDVSLLASLLVVTATSMLSGGMDNPQTFDLKKPDIDTN